MGLPASELLFKQVSMGTICHERSIVGCCVTCSTISFAFMGMLWVLSIVWSHDLIRARFQMTQALCKKFACLYSSLGYISIFFDQAICYAFLTGSAALATSARDDFHIKKAMLKVWFDLICEGIWVRQRSFDKLFVPEKYRPGKQLTQEWTMTLLPPWILTLLYVPCCMLYRQTKYAAMPCFALSYSTIQQCEKDSDRLSCNHEATWSQIYCCSG